MNLDPTIVNGFSSFHQIYSQPFPDREILGSYDRRRFVLQLADDVHRRLGLSDHAPGEVYFSTASSEEVQAFSTYLHETIHWWQHIGSFAGFLQTCIFSANTHLNHGLLRDILADHGPKKSILRFLASAESGADSRKMDKVNIVINNTIDLGFFIAATQDPANLPIIAKDKFYEGRGHCFKLTGFPRPETVRSSTVGLFLLICDLAINPVDGFPLPIRSFDTFVDDVDPRLFNAVDGLT